MRYVLVPWKRGTTRHDPKNRHAPSCPPSCSSLWCPPHYPPSSRRRPRHRGCSSPSCPTPSRHCYPNLLGTTCSPAALLPPPPRVLLLLPPPWVLQPHSQMSPSLAVLPVCSHLSPAVAFSPRWSHCLGHAARRCRQVLPSATFLPVGPLLSATLPRLVANLSAAVALLLLSGSLWAKASTVAIWAAPNSLAFPPAGVAAGGDTSQRLALQSCVSAVAVPAVAVPAVAVPAVAVPVPVGTPSPRLWAPPPLSLSVLPQCHAQSCRSLH